MRLTKNQRVELEKRVLGDLLCLVNPEHVLTATQSGMILINGTPITPQEAAQLKSEVTALKRMRIWTIFNETLKEHAQRTMFENSEDFEAMRSGKMLLYAIKTQNTILDAIEKAKTIKPKPAVVHSS